MSKNPNGKAKVESVMKRLILTIALLLLLPTSASARSFESTEFDMYRLAVAYWGGQPNGCMEISLQVQPSLGDNYGLAGGCSMEIAQAATETDPRILCRIIVHERGHMIGLGHSTDPRDVMYSGPASLESNVSVCDNPATSIAALPPYEPPTWIEWGEHLHTRSQILTARREACKTKRCRRRLVPSQRRLRVAQKELQVTGEANPVIR